MRGYSVHCAAIQCNAQLFSDLEGGGAAYILAQQQHDTATRPGADDVLHGQREMQLDGGGDVAVEEPDAYQRVACRLAACASAAPACHQGEASLALAAPALHPVACPASVEPLALPSCVESRQVGASPFAAVLSAWGLAAEGAALGRFLHMRHLVPLLYLHQVPPYLQQQHWALLHPVHAHPPVTVASQALQQLMMSCPHVPPPQIPQVRLLSL